MPEIDLDELEERHTPYSDGYRFCTCCEATPWPCEVIQLVQHLRQLQKSEKAAIENVLAVFDDDHDRICEAMGMDWDGNMGWNGRVR